MISAVEVLADKIMEEGSIEIWSADNEAVGEFAMAGEAGEKAGEQKEESEA